MQEINFKKEFRQGLLTYLHVSQPYTTLAQPIAGKDEILYNEQLHIYIALAEYITSHLQKFVIIKFSPYLSKLSFLTWMGTINWKYIVLANDQFGLGIDKGFVNVDENSGELIQLCSLRNLLLLTEVPEDTFGDATSSLTIFGLNDDRINALEILMQSPQQPLLSEFLQQEEIFIHINCSKETGYYNSLLIKSKEDIEQKLFSFETVIAPDN